jgi:hypothetical protein
MKKTNRKHLTQIENFYNLKKEQKVFIYKQENYKKIMIMFFLVMAVCVFVMLLF